MADDPDTTETTDSNRPTRTSAPSDYFRIFTYATRWDLCVYAIAVVASIGAGVTMPLMNVIFGQLVGQFTDYTKVESTGNDFNQVLDRQALYIMALFIVRWALISINKFCFRMIGIRLSSAIRQNYLQALFSQPIHVIDSMAPGAPATAITTTSNTLQLGISERLGTCLQSLVTILTALVIAFTWSWDLTLVTLSLIIYIILATSITLPLIVKGQTAVSEADAEATSIASEALAGIRLVMACSAQNYIISQYTKWVVDSKKKGQKMGMILGLQVGLVFFGMFGTFGLAFWYGAKRYSIGAISNSGVVIVVLMSVLMILMSVERVASPLIAVSKATAAACEFFTLIDAPVPLSGTLQPDISSEDLILDNVSFEYPSRPGVKILDALSFVVRNGQNTALVGPSGSGKSTIVGLLEQWYSLTYQHTIPQVVTAGSEAKSESNSEPVQKEEPDGVTTERKSSGAITIGEHNLEELDLKWWRTQIGLVQQEPFLFNDTIFGNVAHGLIGTPWMDKSEPKKRELVQEACREAYAEEFIKRLPNGYDTRVGDGGAKLSGGQKQRLAIARCIVKKPKIMILDEATSAIDTKSERLVQAALDKVTSNRTTITIAHRLSTIKQADHIIVLQKGQAVEQGTHNSLMADPLGVYRSLVDAQSLQTLETGGENANTTASDLGDDVEKVLDSPNNDELGIEEQVIAGQQAPRNLFQNFGRIIYEQRHQWPYYIGIVISSMAIAAGTPLQAWLFAKIINIFLLEGDELRREASFLGLMWLALAGGVGIAWLITIILSSKVQYAISAAYKIIYAKDILQQEVSFFDQDTNSHGTLSSRVASDAKCVEELFGQNLAMFLSGIFTIVGCIIIALIFSWKLGLVAMCVTMPIMGISGLWKYRHEIKFDEMNSAVFMESSQFATEAVGAMRTVSALTMESIINDRYRSLLDGHVQAARIKAQWTSALFGFADSVGLGCQALVFWYGGKLLISGEYTMDAFFVCFMAIIQGAEQASQVLSIAPNAAQALAATNRIFDIHHTAEVGQVTTRGSEKVPKSVGGMSIELQDVHFKYPTRDVSIYNGLSLTIEKGQFVAFVGPSGCGKTTIISLLERFYDVKANRGAILCNGIDIRRFDLDEYRRNFSLVSQEPNLFCGTIRDNILFGLADPKSVTEGRIHQVCRDAYIHDFIVSLPEGYNTAVGQKGVSMSGGQKQRIAIARALIRDPLVLLLDEATSALDSKSEKIVQAAFDRLRHGRTMIAVAHRLSTIQGADVIFVFGQGSVVEKGSHVELLKRRGVYWDMCQSQALDQ